MAREYVPMVVPAGTLSKPGKGGKAGKAGGW